jgi:hypothetical protein
MARAERRWRARSLCNSVIIMELWKHQLLHSLPPPHNVAVRPQFCDASINAAAINLKVALYNQDSRMGTLHRAAWSTVGKTPEALNIRAVLLDKPGLPLFRQGNRFSLELPDLLSIDLLREG